jgi:hypothetical protein
MPSRGDDKYFGGKPGAASEAFKAMQRTYGRKDGEHVYYARIAKAKRAQKKARPFGRFR